MLRSKTVFLSFLLILVLSLSACGSAGTGSGAGSGSAAGGGDGGVIKVGINAELSGNVASYGQSFVQGVELAVAKINAEGGLLDGKKVELVKVDNKSDAAESTNAALRLMTQDQVVAIIGAATSGNTLAMVDLANENQIPVISPSATSPVVTVDPDTGETHEYIFRVCFIDPVQGRVAARFALEELGARRAAIFSDSSSDYAKGLAAAFKEAFVAGGGQIVAEESYVQDDTDFQSQLTRIKAANPDFVFVPGYYEEVGLIVKQAREDVGLTVPMMGGDGWDSPTLVELAGAENLNNTFFTNHYSSQDPDPRIQEFIQSFQAKYNEVPNGFNALGYDAMMLLADAIKRAGSADPVAIKDALEQTKDVQLVTGTISIDEQHNPVKAAVVIEYKDGKQTFRTKVSP
ncbi:amino acid/amide ABC transporter substrate-binding protein, HAAT family [Thermaerobacter marianensis DSM 12885]|uniref:Amino acid/amide ABC transporter substrate-binding protein, HAAT family n=1 Tax=Thermaerobacter marianensis (strain ATCC 700841 / DSM 12885 / JCM 10246 / 7p75a) TaxID=644966 RepID=E6SHS6_THEM7|nr:ABC transporter substrate-binding protein [Thermaerobacter marianensis]ADU50773.1 amino acid/amide ABC transporter substrate-binding protein, HAAT family [Thermaerobacter marianensis DSM 12885]